MQKQKVSAVVSAYNEEETIYAVIEQLKKCSLINEIIVINDGSNDKTVEIALQTGVIVLSHKKNLGKAKSMETGIEATKYPIIIFVDADIIGFTPPKMEKIILPVIKNNFIMYIGIVKRRTYWLNKIIRLLPLISGLRVIKKELWYKIPDKYKNGYQMEIALNYFASNSRQKTGHCFLGGIKHVTKEKKRGIVVGTLSRIKMGLEITFIGFRLYILKNIHRKIF